MIEFSAPKGPWGTIIATDADVIDLESKKVATTFANTDTVAYTVTDSTITIRG